MKKNELKLGIILSYITLILSNVIGIVYTPIMLRYMGQSEYGLYSLVASIVGYLTILDLGLGNATVRYISKYKALGDKENEYNLNGTFLLLYSAIGIVSFLIGYLLYTNIDAIFSQSLSMSELIKAKIMMKLLVFNISISFPLSIFGSIMTAYEKFIFPKIINIIRTLINPLIMIPLLIMGYKSVAMVSVITILNIICLLVNVIYCFTKLNIKFKFNRYDKALIKEITGYSFFIFLNIIVDKLYWSTDQLILGAFSGTKMVAIYAIGSQINGYYMNFSTAISGVFLPKITSMVANNKPMKDISDLFIKVGRIQIFMMSLILTGFILFGEEFILIWSGKEYINSYYIALLVMLPSIIPLTQNVGISILQAQNRHKFRSCIYLLIAILNVIISMILVKPYGAIGCAIATSTSILLGQIIIMNIYYYKKVQIDIPTYWIELIKISKSSIIMIIIGILINKLVVISGIIALLLKILIYTVCFCIVNWNLSLNSYEKKLCTDVIKKVIKRNVEKKNESIFKEYN